MHISFLNIVLKQLAFIVLNLQPILHVEQFNGFPEQTSHELAYNTEEMSKFT